MALRSLGSSLIARNAPGTALRKKQEERSSGAVSSGAEGAQLGSAQRGLVTEPLNRETPAGTQKVVSVQPTVQPTLKTGQAPTAGMVPQMGGAANAVQTGTSIRAGAPTSPPPGGGGAGKVAPVSGKAPTSISGGPVASARPAVAFNFSPEPTPTPQRVQNPVSQSQGSQYQPVSLLGNRVIADQPGGQPRLVTTGQQIAGSVGKAVSAVGNVIKSPAVTNFGNKMQSTGGQIAQGNIGGSVKAAVSNVAKTVQKTVQKLSGLLRSLFR